MSLLTPRWVNAVLVAGLFVAVLVSAVAHAREGDIALPRLRVTLEPAARPHGLGARLGTVFRELRARAIGVVRPSPGTVYRVTATAYSSTVGQTDLTPCITAAGTRVRPGVIATNFLPLGTRLRIGEHVYVVEDRMNERYNGKYIIDIWHPTTAQAREFGAQLLEIEILGLDPNFQRGGASPEPSVAPATAPTAAPVDAPAEPALSPPPEPAGVFVRIRSGGATFLQRIVQFLSTRADIPEEEDCLTLPAPTPD